MRTLILILSALSMASCGGGGSGGEDSAAAELESGSIMMVNDSGCHFDCLALRYAGDESSEIIQCPMPDALEAGETTLTTGVAPGFYDLRMWDRFNLPSCDVTWLGFEVAAGQTSVLTIYETNSKLTIGDPELIATD